MVDTLSCCSSLQVPISVVDWICGYYFFNYMYFWRVCCSFFSFMTQNSGYIVTCLLLCAARDLKSSQCAVHVVGPVHCTRGKGHSSRKNIYFARKKRGILINCWFLKYDAAVCLPHMRQWIYTVTTGSFYSTHWGFCNPSEELLECVFQHPESTQDWRDYNASDPHWPTLLVPCARPTDIWHLGREIGEPAPRPPERSWVIMRKVLAEWLAKEKVVICRDLPWVLMTCTYFIFQHVSMKTSLCKIILNSKNIRMHYDRLWEGHVGGRSRFFQPS